MYGELTFNQTFIFSRFDYSVFIGIYNEQLETHTKGRSTAHDTATSSDMSLINFSLVVSSLVSAVPTGYHCQPVWCLVLLIKQTK